MITPEYCASLCQNDASGSYLDLLPDEAFPAGDSITVERAGRTFCAKRASLPDARVFLSAYERKGNAFLRCNHIYPSLVISDKSCSIRDLPTVSGLSRIPTMPCPAEACVLSHRSLPERIEFLSTALDYCAVQSVFA